VLSATQDAAANAAFQAAPSRPTRSNAPLANDLFGDLVSQNTPNDATAAPPPPPPLPPPAQNGADTPPPAADNAAPANNANNNASSANNNAPTPPANDDSSNVANDGPPSNNDSSDATAPANANNNGAAANSTATGASTDSSQSGTTAQTSTTDKQTANLAAQGTTTDAAAASAASARDHAATAAAAHVVADAADPSAQALGAVQPQLNSSSGLGQTSNLTATAASNGAVPLSGLAVEIAANVKSGKSSFEIRLDPADLGRIDVRVQIDQNGQVTSHLTVEKPETLSMLRQDAPQLQQALNDAGLKTGSGGLQFSLRDQSSGQNGGNDGNRNAQRLIITDEDAVPASVAGRYGRSTGSSSGVDIRV
jgi:flagellar hook-length control protein FliK